MVMVGVVREQGLPPLHRSQRPAPRAHLHARARAAAALVAAPIWGGEIRWQVSQRRVRP
jgi:hypothetical protein